MGRGAGCRLPVRLLGREMQCVGDGGGGEKSFGEPLVLPGKRSYNYRLPLKFFGASVADAIWAK